MLQSEELARDVTEAEEMLNRHRELKTDIENKDEKFNSLLSLGRGVLASAKNPQEIQERFRQLTNERAELKDLWERRNKQLKQSSDLQVRVHTSHKALVSQLRSLVDFFARS